MRAIGVNPGVVPDIDKVSALIREVAEAEILPRFRRLGEDDSWEKGSGSLVTVADQRAEERLGAGLREIVPGSAVVGEEAVEERPELLELLRGDDAVWIVDPIDGTKNFAAGEPRFAVMVAYMVGGETRAAWIHDPIRNLTAAAVEGEGAWLGGARLKVADAVKLARMTGSLGKRLREFPDFAGRFAAVTNTKCCGADYLAIVQGEIHFAYYRALKPWDHAAGQLLHSEAGGYNARLGGAPYRPGERADDGLLLAPDRKHWAAIAAAIPAALEATQR